VLRGDIEEIVLGEGSNLQDGVLAHTSAGLGTIVGRETTVGHGAVLHGCRIGARCLIGMRAIILDGADVEEDCIVGAGALVPEGLKVPRGSVVYGVPGRIVRQVTPEEKEFIRQSARKYRETAQVYKTKNGGL
jgi:carbonic anhydrase/acetyltransferase-like protein (isoleucine patch superfamily)